MLKGKKAKGKKVVPAPAVMKKQEPRRWYIPFEKRPKNFGFGQDIQPLWDSPTLSTAPLTFGCSSKGLFSIKYLKVPPAVNQFTQALDHQTGTQLLKLAHKYRPETKQEKTQKLLAWAEKKAASKGDVPKRPPVLPAGVNIATTLVEKKKAQLVVTAHDMEPIKLDHLALCIKMGVPYCIIKRTARVGHLVHRKICTTRLTQKTTDLRLSWQKLSGPIGMTDMMRSTASGEAMSQNQSR